MAGVRMDQPPRQCARRMRRPPINPPRFAQRQRAHFSVTFWPFFYVKASQAVEYRTEYAVQ